MRRESAMGHSMSLSRIVHRLKVHSRRALTLAGFDFYQRTDDRRLLEQVILPHFAAREAFAKVLFVGCAWYTRGYRRIFSQREYITLDIEPARRRFGSRTRHIVDSLANLERHFAPCELDLLICNGVYGWGLDDRAEAERAFAACHACLREGGAFILGWNDIPQRRPFPLEESAGLQRFKPQVFAPVGSHRVTTANANRHIFDFYTKE